VNDVEFLVTMTTHVPAGTPEQAVADMRAREAARSRVLVELSPHPSDPAILRPPAAPAGAT
jgi:muconolactone D-isomerase